MSKNKVSRRKRRSLTRLRTAQSKKRQGFQSFVTRLAQRRNLPLFPSDSCALGNIQKVADVRKAGNGQLVKSCACSGCYSMQDVVKGTPEEALGCQAIQRRWFYLHSKDLVQKGDLLVAPSLESEATKRDI